MMRRIQCICFLMFLISFSGCKNSDTFNSDLEIDITTNSNEATLFAPGLISTEKNERDIAISSDGNEIIYTLATHDNSNRVLVSLKKNNGKWMPPRILSFCGRYHDIEPFFSPNDKHLYFASTRPLKGETDEGDYNIWRADFVNGDWSLIQPLDSIVNSDVDEYYPSLSSNGNLYFTAAYSNALGREDIYKSEFINGHYQTPQPIDSNVNSVAYEFNAFISPDENLLIFSSYGREDDYGGGDLYYSKKNKDGNWSLSQNFGEHINSDKLDYCPFVDFNNKNFYFTSNRKISFKDSFDLKDMINTYSEIQNGLGNIYHIQLDKTGL